MTASRRAWRAMLPAALLACSGRAGAPAAGSGGPAQGMAPGAPAAGAVCAPRRYTFPAEPGAPAPIAGPVPCRGGFCVENAPSGGGVWQLAGAPGALWAVGPGTLLRGEAAGWTTACPPGGRSDLRAIGGRSADAVWVGGGDGYLARWDGAGWVETASPPGTGAIAQVCGDAREAFAADDRGAVLRWDGAGWSIALAGPAATATAGAVVWCAGEGHAFASTPGGTFEWAGGAWAALKLPAGARPVWAAPGGDLWAAGSRTLPGDPALPPGSPGSGPRDVPTLLRRDGAAWTDVALPVAGSGVTGIAWVAGSGGNDVWVGLGDPRSSQAQTWRFDGATWRAGPSGAAAFTAPFVWGPAQAWLGYADLYALGADGAWTKAVDAGPGVLGPAAAAGPGELWMVDPGAGALLRLEATAWRRVGADPGLRLSALSASGPADVWAAGYRMAGVAPRAVALQWDGATFTARDLPPPAAGTTSQATAAFARRPGEAWVATVEGGFWDGAPRVHRWDGAAWTTLDPGLHGGFVLRAWASGPEDLWLLAMTLAAPGGALPSGASEGAGNAVLHWDGAAWTARTWPGAALRALGGTGPRDVWVSGTVADAARSTAVLARWDGARWSDVPGPALSALAVDAGTLWGITAPISGGAVEPEGRLVRLERGAWTEVAGPVPAGSLAVAAGEAWVVAGGAALHRDPR